MKKEYYLFQVTSTYVTKNKLEEAVFDYIKMLDRTLFEADRIGDFKKHFAKTIQLINDEHKRCKPIVFDWHGWEKKRGLLSYSLHFRGAGICNVSLSCAFYEPITESF